MSEDPRFRLSKAFITSFIQDHIEAIEQYREDHRNDFSPMDPAETSGKVVVDIPAIHDKLEIIKNLAPGNKDADKYHDTVFTLLKFVFDWCFENFEKEYKMDQGRGRIDIMCDNFASGGLLKEWRTSLNASSVPIECKNYKADLGNEEFNQLNDRLGDKSSRLGFLFCRTIHKPEEMSRHVTDRWLRHHNCILLFDDKLLRRLTLLRLTQDYKEIESILRIMLRNVQNGSSSRFLEEQLLTL